MFINNPVYQTELKHYIEKNHQILAQLDGCKIAVTGAAGLIGTYLIDLIMKYQEVEKRNITVCAVDIDEAELLHRFHNYLEHPFFTYRIMDVAQDWFSYKEQFDYIIHGASKTSPIEYTQYPVETMEANVIGTYRLLQYCVQKKVKRFLFCSSVEVYGKNNGDIDDFSEAYSGYVDCNTVRSVYPTGKRMGETMCNAFHKQYGVNFVTARIGRVYGPTVISGDAKAPTQFIMNGIHNENIILKSNGLQEYSFCYVGDCAVALLYILLKGDCGVAYNVADERSKVLLKDFAEAVALSTGMNCVFKEQNELEKAGYSKITKATMNTAKIEELGWRADYGLKEGIRHTIEILRGEKTWKN